MKTDIISNDSKSIYDTAGKLNKGALDELFIKYYIDSADMTESYTRACIKIGHTVSKYASQYASEIYKRLRPKIDLALNEAELDDDLLGRAVQRELAVKGESETTRLQAANALRRKKTEKLEISDNRDIDDIDTEITRLQKQIAEEEGITLQ